MTAVLFAYCSVSLVAYAYLWRSLTAIRSFQKQSAQRLTDVLSDLTSPPALYTLDEAQPVAVVDDGASPVSSPVSASPTLDW